MAAQIDRHKSIVFVQVASVTHIELTSSASMNSLS